MEQILTSEQQREEKYKKLIEDIETGNIRMSFSAFREFSISPRHFIAYKLREKKQTPRMKFGSLVHCLVLEDEDTFNEKYVIEPNLKPASAAMSSFAEMVAAGADISDAYACNYAEKKPDKIAEKAAELRVKLHSYIEHLQSIGNRQEVSKSDYEKAILIRDRLFKDPDSAWILEGLGETEKRIEWQYDGFNWVGVLDGIGDFILADLKLMPDVQPRKTYWKILEMKYHWQAAFYNHFSGQNKLYHILAFDDLANTLAIEIEQDDIDRAIRDIEYYMTKFRQCIINNEWHRSHGFYATRRSGVYKFSDLKYS